MSTISRRSLLQLGAIAATSALVPATAKTRTGPQPADSAWQIRSHRWIQVAFTEDDPGNYDPELWFRYFQEIRAQGACLSAGGAIAFYPTDVPFHHRSSYLGTGDSFGEMVRGCRKLGMAVIGRVDPHSINEEAFAAHPEWAARLADGSPMRHWADPTRYVTCAHGPYNFEFMPRVIREIVERYQVDAIFGNRWDGHTVCHCASCQRLFREATGFAIPETMDPADPVRRAYMVWENEHLYSLIDLWTATIRKVAAAGLLHARLELAAAAATRLRSAATGGDCLHDCGPPGEGGKHTGLDQRAQCQSASGLHGQETRGQHFQHWPGGTVPLEGFSAKPGRDSPVARRGPGPGFSSLAV